MVIIFRGTLTLLYLFFVKNYLKAKRIEMKYLLYSLLLLLLSGCAIKPNKSHVITQENQIKIQQLSKAIASLDKSVNKKEAIHVALIAVNYPKTLAKEYQLVSPPLWHNTLINMNIKQRGFCYHFAQDLLKELKRHDITTLDLQWVTHKKNQYWEHNAVLIKAKNQSFTQGIVLDAWRNSGDLYWNYLSKDTQYHWQYDIQKSRYYGN